MFRAALTLLRRITFATALLFLLVCGAEVAVRIYETVSSTSICQGTDGICNDPSKLTIPSGSAYAELKPSATASVECRDSKTEVELHTNSWGLRGPEPVVPKPSNTYRIVVLGDETIFAPETPESDHFCTHLQSLLQPQTPGQLEVINAGIPGHCPLTEFVFFKQRLLGLQPDLVVLHFDWSDVADDRQIRRLAQCDETGVPLSCPNAKLTATKKVRKHDVWRQQFRLLDWVLSSVGSELKQQAARQRAISRDTDANPYAWLRDEHPEKNSEFRQAVQPILALGHLCQSSHCQFVVMTSPKPWQVSAKCCRGPGVRLNAGVSRDACYPNRTPFNLLARFVDRENIPYIDGSTVFATDEAHRDFYLKYSPRWTSTGHQRFAELVANSLLERVAGPWSNRNPSRVLNDEFAFQAPHGRAAVATGAPGEKSQEQPITRTQRGRSDIQRTSGQRLGSQHP